MSERWRGARGLRSRGGLVSLVLAVSVALGGPAGAQDSTDGETYGPVRPADTLWELAVRFRGDTDASAHQVMIAILRANPEAFHEGNINALRARVTLRVPTPEEMKAVSWGEAIAEYARHEEAWRNRRRTGTANPGGPPAAAPAPATDPSPRPSSAPAPTTSAAPDEGNGRPAELREALSTVADLRQRLVERDEAIEELLIQLAAVRREMRRLQGDDVGGLPGPERGASGEVESSRPGWLPVNPLVLGSALIVILVLVVVVTLLRQRSEPEVLPDEGVPDDDQGGDAPRDEGEGRLPQPAGEPGETREDEPREERAGKRAPAPDREAPAIGEEPTPERGRAVRAASPAAAAVVATAEAGGDSAGAEPAAEPEEESTDLPFGLDLEAEEHWEAESAEPIRTSPRIPDTLPEVGQPVEVGELDRLDPDPDEDPHPRSDPAAEPGGDEDLPRSRGPRNDAGREVPARG